MHEASAGRRGGKDGGCGGEATLMRPSLFRRRVLVLFLFPLFLIACAHDFYVNEVELQQKWLPFLEDGKTTKEEVESKLGVPFYEYKDGRIWAHTMLITEEGSLERNASGHYHLVLVFDENNILRKHSLLRFKP